MFSDWQNLLATCKDRAHTGEAHGQLHALRDRWLSQPDLTATAATIAGLLRTGEDATTGLSFKPGPGGSLRGWPSLRVFLLDLLQTLDPDQAVEISREILATTRSAEEFAVALRPLARRGPARASAAELNTHLATLLSRNEWQAERRPGFVEALDLARATATPETTRLIAAWLDSRPPVAHAGAMALHETAAETPAAVVPVLATDPSLLDGQPTLRASLMARAAAVDAAQAAAIDHYLANPAVAEGEKREFLRLYPLRSATTGDRLYGNPPQPFRRDAVVADDQAALTQVDRWLADPRFAALQPDIQALQSRLLTWTAQAKP